MHRRAAAALLVATLAAACGLSVAGTGTTSGDASDGGLASSTDADSSSALEGSIDAGSSSPDGATADGSNDAASGADADATTLGYCASLAPQPTFCDDFDEGADAGAGWDSILTPGDASVVVDTTHALSSPRALHTASPGFVAGLTKSFAMPNSIDIDADILFHALPATGQLCAFQIRGAGSYIYFQADAVDSYFQYGPPDISTHYLTPLTLDAWHHVSVHLENLAVASSITASIDGTTLWSSHTLTAGFTSITLYVGTPAFYLVTDGETFVDNVKVVTH
jgi:hypothetical protein